MNRELPKQLALTNFYKGYKAGGSLLKDFVLFLMVVGISLYLFSAEKRATRFNFIMM